MNMTKLGKALFVALGAASPKLAMDAALPALVGQAAKKTLDKPALKAKLVAMDADLKPETIDLIMDALADIEKDPEPKETKKETVGDEGETEEEKEAREKKEKAAKDAKCAKDAEEVDAKKKDETKAAMDGLRAELRDADEARRAVRPVVGDVIAQDSAESIYAFALDHLKCDHQDVTGIPALKALFRVASSKNTPAPRIAQDAAGLTKQFPNAARFRQA